MTERGLPSVDGAPACPFVAFGDDRDGRATSPDHRHRCFAETPPAPRALAHQEAYCLSSAFPVCPTFQDWAKREAAHARGAGERAESAPTAVATSDGPSEPDDTGVPEPPRQPISEPPVRRNPPRDWAAPPPWASGPGGSAGSTRASSRGPAEDSPEFLASRSTEGAGLAGSAADRLAGGPVPPSSGAAGLAAAGSMGAAGAAGIGAAGIGPAAAAASVAPDDDLADLVQRRASSASAGRTGGRGYSPPPKPARRPSVSSTRPPADTIAGPAWERMRRYEAYPTIRTRAGLPALPRVAVFAGALGIAALALFFLPALLGVGGGGGGATPNPSASRAVASASTDPTAVPAPTTQVYVIKANDTLLKLAKRFGLTLDELLAANPSIKNPNKIAVGDKINIPVPSGSTAPSGSATP